MIIILTSQKNGEPHLTTQDSRELLVDASTISLAGDLYCITNSSNIDNVTAVFFRKGELEAIISFVNANHPLDEEE